MENDFTSLLSPLSIGTKTIRNRVLISAHVPGFAENNQVSNRYVKYHLQYARAGVGLQITGGTPVHKSGLLSSSGDGIWNLSDAVIPGYQKLSEAIHEQGGCILAQLAHSAGTVLINQPGRESWSASAVRSEITGNISHSMSLSEIEEIVEAYGQAAKRVRKGNLDGVEILSAFGFLPQAFLSPPTNFREDHYGGSLDNRMRFLIEVLQNVRTALGGDKILGVRVPGDEFEPGGLGLEQMQQVCKILSDLQFVDYINVIAHTNLTHTGRSKHWAPTPTPHGVFVDLASSIKQVVEVPVFAVGRIIDPRHANRIISQGKADMVGMTRAHICDPDIVPKIRANALSQIRPCVGANTCIANRYAGKPIQCMHNALVSTPGQSLSIAEKRQRVAVVGAGPAGLEAARIAAECGHDVEVYESTNRAGGQLAIWAAGYSFTELQKIIDWRLSELNRLNIQIQFGKEIRRSDLLELDANIVIVATGSVDQVRVYPGDQSIEIVSPHAVLKNLEIKSKRVLVCSDGRGQAGLVAAEHLAHAGVEVEVISSDFAVAADLDPTFRNLWYERLGKLGTTLTDRTEIVSIGEKQVQLQGVFSQMAMTRADIDLVVDWNRCVATDEILSGDEPMPEEVKVMSIGDCVAPRNLEVAMAEALKVAQGI